MAQPRGFEIPGEPNKVYQLLRNLYGTHQAGALWQKLLNEKLTGIGLKATGADPCVYYRSSDGAMAAMHVDDMLSVVPKETRSGGSGRESMVAEIGNLFKVADNTDKGRFLGVRITHDEDRGVVQMSQREYFETILARFGLSDCNPAVTPLAPGCVLSKEDCPDVETAEGRQRAATIAKWDYQGMVGCLMWAMLATRPDIAYAVQTLSKYMKNPGEAHCVAAKHCLRYIAGTRDKGITYRRGDITPWGYTDADWGSSPDDRRSVSGFVFLMAGGAVSWSSKRQPTVALSTAEAEYMAASHGAKEAMWLRRLVADTGGELNSVRVLGDNQGAIALTKNPVFHARTKHIDIHHHFVRERVSEGSVVAEYVPTGENIADAMTKALPRPAFTKCRAAMGVE